MCLSCPNGLGSSLEVMLSSCKCYEIKPIALCVMFGLCSQTKATAARAQQWWRGWSGCLLYPASADVYGPFISSCCVSARCCVWAALPQITPDQKKGSWWLLGVPLEWGMSCSNKRRGTLWLAVKIVLHKSRKCGPTRLCWRQFSCAGCDWGYRQQDKNSSHHKVYGETVKYHMITFCPVVVPVLLPHASGPLSLSDRPSWWPQDHCQTEWHEGEAHHHRARTETSQGGLYVGGTDVGRSQHFHFAVMQLCLDSCVDLNQECLEDLNSSVKHSESDVCTFFTLKLIQDVSTWMSRWVWNCRAEILNVVCY